MTLTLPALLDSRQIYLHLSGKEKRDVYERALAGYSVEEMPIRAVLDQDIVPVDVYRAGEQGINGYPYSFLKFTGSGQV